MEEREHDVLAVEGIQVLMPMSFHPAEPARQQLVRLDVSAALPHLADVAHRDALLAPTTVSDECKITAHQGLNYSTLAKFILSKCPGAESLAGPFMKRLLSDLTLAFPALDASPALTLSLTLPKASLQTPDITLELTRRGADASAALTGRILVRRLTTQLILGLNEWERTTPQRITLHATLALSPAQVSHGVFPVCTLVERLVARAVASTFKTIEALTLDLVTFCTKIAGARSVSLTVQKLNALSIAAHPSITMTRHHEAEMGRGCDGKMSVYLAFGANLGHRWRAIQNAIRLLDGASVGPSATLSLVQTSLMYETTPCYVTEQPCFLNCVAQFELSCGASASQDDLAALASQLLNLTQEVERKVGRLPSFRNGPRCIDVDILFFGDLVLADPRLTLPHPLLHERLFVLVPLLE